MMRRLLSVLAVVLMLAGCSGAPAAAPSRGSAPATTAAAPGPSEKELQTARKEAGIANCPRSDDQAARADGLPDITLDCLGSDRTVRLAGLRGRPMVINIWAQWCRPCRIEAPHLSAVAKQAGRSVDFIGIDYADPDPAAAIEFARSAGWRYPQLQDPHQRVKGPLKIIGVPQTFLVDAHGKIVYRQVKPLTSDTQLRALIHDHLGVEL
jgi:thiol-disulfide isomerase/thioredoxin